MALSTKQDNGFIYFVTLAVAHFYVPITSLISCLIYIPVLIISCFFKNYGKFLSYTDIWLDEDLDNIPRSNLVITMVLQGDISLNYLTKIFKNQVLEARSRVNPTKLRYPELQQFVTRFLGFRVWKNDPNFLLENHIKEIPLDYSLRGENVLENVHQKYLNEPYKRNRSPWKMVLIRNIGFQNDQKNLLVFKVHHVMADAKSLLKLLVECLGKKQLKTAVPQVITNESTWNRFKFVVMFPVKFVIFQIKYLGLIFQSYYHPWKNKFTLGKPQEPNYKMMMSFSPEIKMMDIKNVAKKHNVKTSSVVMSIIAGTIKKFSEDQWDKWVSIGYSLPKPKHPEFLTNHVYMGTLGLPIHEVCEVKRLKLCNREFVRVKVHQDVKYINANVMLCGIQIYPLYRYNTNMVAPIGVTNIAGEEEGFSVGNAKCIDFRLSVGTSHGIMGVVFCTVSYKDSMRIAVIANESVLNKETVEKVAKHLKYELDLLMNSL